MFWNVLVTFWNVLETVGTWHSQAAPEGAPPPKRPPRASPGCCHFKTNWNDLELFGNGSLVTWRWQAAKPSHPRALSRLSHALLLA